MNIFMLDKQPYLAAQYHVDRHVTKMMIEYAQILSTVWHVTLPMVAAGHTAAGEMYRPTHRNHPSVKWAASNGANYQWLLSLWMSLHTEYKFRYGSHKSHASFIKTYDRLKFTPWPIQANIGQPGYNGEFVMAREHQAVGDYKQDDPVEAYRDYYRCTKTIDAAGKPMAIWSIRGKPEWF